MWTNIFLFHPLNICYLTTMAAAWITLKQYSAAYILWSWHEHIQTALFNYFCPVIASFFCNVYICSLITGWEDFLLPCFFFLYSYTLVSSYEENIITSKALYPTLTSHSRSYFWFYSYNQMSVNRLLNGQE